MPVATLESVSFSYGRNRVLNDIDLNLDNGATGILGPNGAGKTTMLQLLTLNLRPSIGSIKINGAKVTNEAQARKCRGLIGYLPQRFEVMSLRSVRANVEFAAWAHGVPTADCARAADHAIARVGLEDRSNTRAFRLSGGMRQRLGLACVIAHEPKILILDEPTVGIDPVQRSQMRKLFRELSADSAVLLSTHLIDDVTHVCDRVLVLNHGAVRFDGSVNDLEQIGREGVAQDRHGSAAENGYLRIVQGHES